MYLLDKFENKYIIKGVLRAESPIHIGAGDNDFTAHSVDNAVIRDENGNPYIPGSSLKGVIRTFIERIINAEIFNENECKYTACDIFNNPCISKVTYNEIKSQSLDRRELALKVYEKECDVCKLFGSNYFASKIHIDDAKVKISDKKVRTEIRDGVAIDRDTLTAANTAKYTFECVCSGTEFEFEMSIDNLDEKDEKNKDYEELLQSIITFLESGDMLIGGKTSSGLGSIKLINTSVYKIEKSTAKEYFLNGLNELKKSWLYDLEAKKYV